MSSPVAYGIHAVRVMLSRNPQRVRRVLVSPGREAGRLGELKALAQRAGVQVVPADDALLDRLADGGRHQGVVAEVAPQAGDPETQLEEALEAASGPPLLLVLDGVQDPHNLGALIRTAACSGVHGVLIPKDRAAHITPAVEKASAGAVETVPVVQVVNVALTIDELKKDGFWIYGAAGNSPTSVYEQDFSGNVAIVVGSEGEGIRPLVRKKCDALFSIPLMGGVSSLNASVAGGVILFEIVRQRFFRKV